MRLWAIFACLILAACDPAATTTMTDAAALSISSVEPRQVTARGGDLVKVSGAGFAGGVTVRLGEVEVVARSLTPTSFELVVPAMPVGLYDLRVARPGIVVTAGDALDVAPFSLAYRELAPWFLPALPGKVDAVAALANGIAVGGQWGLVWMHRQVDAITLHVAAGLPDKAEVRALAAGRSGRHLAACTRTGLSWLEAADEAVTVASSIELPSETGPGPGGTITTDCLALAVGGSVEAPMVYAWRRAKDAVQVLQWKPGQTTSTTLSLDGLPVSPTALAVVDGNGDGRDDLLLAGRASGMARTELRVGDEGSWFVDLGGLPPRSETTRAFVPVDVDEDGDVDLIGIGSGSDALWVNDGAGRFVDEGWRRLPFERGEGAGAAAADLDHDGRDDLVIAVPDALDRLFLSGAERWIDGTEALGLIPDLGGKAVVLADLAGDAEADVVTLRPDGSLRVRVSVDPREAQP